MAVPLRRLDHAGEHFQRRRFARAVGPEKADDLPGGDLKRKRVDGGLLAEILG